MIISTHLRQFVLVRFYTDRAFTVEPYPEDGGVDLFPQENEEEYKKEELYREKSLRELLKRKTKRNKPCP